MPSYLSPGVYLEEIPSGSKPIEGVATSVTAFVGFANRGEVGKPTLIGNFDDYVNEYGPIADENDAMGLAVQAFYLNGGGSAYVCRLAGEFEVASSENNILGEGSYDSGTNTWTRTTAPVLTISASSPGQWGDDLRYIIEKSHRDTRRFSLVIGVLENGEFAELERFDDLSMNANSEDFILNLVNGNSQLVTIDIPDALSYQSARVTGAPVELAALQAFLGDATKDRSFSISVNGSHMTRITLSSNIDGSSTADNIAEDIQDQIDTALANPNISVAAAGAGPITFTIATSGEFDSTHHISLGDSELLNTLGLSTDNVATLTGSALGASPSILADSGFNLTLDHYSVLDIVFESDLIDGDAIASEIQRQVRSAFPNIASFSGFTCTHDTDHLVMFSGGSNVLESNIEIEAPAAGIPNAVPNLGLNSPTVSNGRSIQQGTDQVIPQSNSETGLGESLSGGSATSPVATDFTAFYTSTLRKYRDVSIMVLPGSTWDGGIGQANIAATLAHCEALKNRVVIIDPQKDLELTDAVVVNALSLPTSTYSVLYYPWVHIANPKYHPDKAPDRAKTVSIAPSAIAAGMWAKIDGKRGVWKAPAGVETRLTGAVNLRYSVETLEQDQLNPLGINCIRRLPNYGSVFWGARSLATKADPEWRYVPVRRTAIYIEQSIYNGIQWAVFEPNDHPLWSSLRGNIGSFMNGMFRAGAFQGKTANDAYFVRCGLGDTMTQGDIDRGQVIVIVGFAPLKPAEFVIVRIQQKVGEL